MQPSEEDQGQSVVLASHSGLGFVAVHVGKVLKSLREQQNFLQLSAVKQYNLIRTINPSSIFDLSTHLIDIYL